MRTLMPTLSMAYDKSSDWYIGLTFTCKENGNAVFVYWLIDFCKYNSVCFCLSKKFNIF